MASLPDLPGPKLHPFNHKGSELKIVFLESIDKGGEGVIWKVSIDDKIYALKIFAFDPHGIVTRLEDRLVGRTTIDELQKYRSPFAAECRAYGRLKETNKENLSIKCYGYIILTSKHEEELRMKGEIPEGIDRRWESHSNLPFQAIVKEYVPEGLRPWPYLDASKVPQMIRDLNDLHRIGIHVNDVKENNYLRDKIIDFGFSRTAPHPYLIPDYIDWMSMNPHARDDTPVQDEEDFDEMIDFYNEMVDEEAATLYVEEAAIDAQIR
ncbi:hypothetical protein JX265_008458 [Neoarthrinium moseri]|uniref:Protein kinase domain-containing protein n=1 Tax=Neoarthrinium moseri TaxID=1658444 RepID=A0A9P9WI91_9PEZI|nr:hypothetical protein JX266_010162 [Neoarthrinium moseri]KAI1864734.1 hypothetical protein JX265_008458 [Neoarthrinium moseri]